MRLIAVPLLALLSACASAAGPSRASVAVEPEALVRVEFEGPAPIALSSRRTGTTARIEGVTSFHGRVRERHGDTLVIDVGELTRAGAWEPVGLGQSTRLVPGPGVHVSRTDQQRGWSIAAIGAIVILPLIAIVYIVSRIGNS